MADTPPLLPGLSPIAMGPTAIGQQQNPPPLPQLPAGTLIAGTVLGQDTKGNPVIQTEAMQVVLRTGFPLPRNSNVVLRLEQELSRNALPGVRIVSVDGKPAHEIARSDLPPTNRPLPGQTGDTVKPVGVLLQAFSRPAVLLKPEAGQPPVPSPLVLNTQNAAIARPALATEVTLSNGGSIHALLLRPADNVQAAEVAGRIQQALGSTIPPAKLLRPGAQMQVSIVQVLPVALPTVAPEGKTIAQMLASAATPPAIPPAAEATQQGTTKQMPIQANVTVTPGRTNQPQTPSAPPSSPNLPTGQEQPGKPSVAAPENIALPPGIKQGYARYAMQDAAQMGRNPTMQAGNIPHPAAPTMAAPPSSSAPLPEFSVPLTLQRVNDLLTQAEVKPLPQTHMVGVVVGKEPSGDLTVHTRMGIFSLPPMQSKTPIQPGTVLIWEAKQLIPGSEHALPPVIESLKTASSLSIASQFTVEGSALYELSALLHTMQTSEAAQALQRMIPHIGSNFSAGLVLFISMLRGGNVRGWIGDDLAGKLEQMGKGDLLQRLGADIGALRNLFADQPQSNWQALFFPVMVDKELHQARMYVKKDEQQNKNGGTGTRFVVEIELSRFGAMQFDGLVKKREGQTSFDLVIRTLAALPEDVQTDIYAIFENAQDATGMRGSLHFRVEPTFPIHPLEEMQEKSGESGSILA